MATLILRPDAAGDETNLTKGGASATNWESVDESSANTTDYVFNTNPTTYVYDSYNLQADSGINADAAIPVVETSDRCIVVAGAGSGDNKECGLRLSSTNSMGAAVQLTTSYVTRTNQFTTNPSGGFWAQSNLAALQVRIGLRENGTSESRCTQLFVTVTYYNVDSRLVAYGGASGASGSQNTATVLNRPSGGEEVIVAIAYDEDNAPANWAFSNSLEDIGLTWTKLQTEQHDFGGGSLMTVDIWRGTGTVDTDAILTAISATGSQGKLGLIACKWPALDANDPVLQITKFTGTSTSPGGTLAAFNDAANDVLAFVLTAAAHTPTVGSGFTALTGTSEIDHFSSQYKLSEDVGVDYTLGASVIWMMVAMELNYQPVVGPAVIIAKRTNVNQALNRAAFY